jgi:hypothetical protein
MALLRLKGAIVKFDSVAAPQVGFGGNMPVNAIRRLLEHTDAANGEYWLICDRDLSGTGANPIHRAIIWEQPELLFPCGDCRGSGEYIGLTERGPCRTCGGRKVVRVRYVPKHL